MSINNYSDLQTEVLKWLDREDDDEVIARLPSFIQLVEAEISRVLRRTTKRTTVTIADESYSLDATIAELRSIRLVTSSKSEDLPIKIVTPEMIAEERARRTTPGRPLYAAVVGGKLIFAPEPDSSYNAELVYFEKLIPLSTSNPTNVVLSEAPDAYLFGVLRESAAFLEHDERIGTWESKFNRALAQLEIVREREEFNASLRPARLSVVF